MLFKILPMSSLGAGPEFYNNPFASNNTIGVEDNKEYFYNNMAAPMQSVGDTGDKASTYNNMGAVGNCVGGTETGCTPFAVGSRAAFI
mmetsp:Transcript_126078/g.188169  ORF Transcript_126078/g.188169 Transcript_126078/m.188169 type:complete len:88 (+) Transcript_126078:1-264(+)